MFWDGYPEHSRFCIGSSALAVLRLFCVFFSVVFSCAKSVCVCVIANSFMFSCCTVDGMFNTNDAFMKMVAVFVFLQMKYYSVVDFASTEYYLGTEH